MIPCESVGVSSVVPTSSRLCVSIMQTEVCLACIYLVYSLLAHSSTASKLVLCSNQNLSDPSVAPGAHDNQVTLTHVDQTLRGAAADRDPIIGRPVLQRSRPDPRGVRSAVWRWRERCARMRHWTHWRCLRLLRSRLLCCRRRMTAHQPRQAPLQGKGQGSPSRLRWRTRSKHVSFLSRLRR